MAENDFRITIEQNESEDEGSREHAAFYETANSTIYISLSHLPDILDDAATEQVVSELTRVGRENMFEDFLLVALYGGLLQGIGIGFVGSYITVRRHLRV